MANISIPNLPVAVNLSGSAQLMIVQGSTSYSATVSQIAGFNTNSGTVTSITAQSPLSGGTITTTGTIGLNTNSIDNTYLANMAARSIKGNNSASPAQPQDLTVAQTMTLLGAAPLASPAFTGNPTAPTPALSDNSTSLATTAYVKSQGFGFGTVTSITAGTGLSGGTITTTGTIAIANTGVSAQTYGTASTVPRIAINAQGQITTANSVTISITPSQVVGLGTMATQNANAVAITGGTIDQTVIGGTTPAAGTFTNLTATGTVSIGTISSGTWQGNPIAVLYGGTGATSASAARTNLGAAASGANNDITSLTGLTTPLAETEGGTGYGSYTTGDILYASSSSTLARLNDVATGNALISGGVGVAPSYGKIGLTTHVTGTLGTANGGTGLTSFTSGGALYATSTSALTSGTLPVLSGGTGVTTSTGTGSVVLSNSPTLVTPTLDVATATSYTATRALSVATPYNTGAFNYGTLGYSDTNIFSSFVNSVNSYNQMVLQNTNAGSAASTNFIVSNDQGSPTGYYGEFGMNSSAFAGTNSFALPNAVYLDSTNGDLVLGTTTANAIRFVVNSNSTDAMSISSAGNTTIANLTLSTALPVASGGTGTTTSTGTGSVVLSNSPTLVTPALGTPSAIVLTNATGLPLTTGVTGTLGTSNGGTGLTSFTSGGAVYASSASVLATGTLPVTAGGTGTTTSTGTGSVVLSNSPTLITPALGTPSALVLTNATGLPLTTGVTGILAVSNGGTGATTLTGYLVGNGTSAFTAVSTIPNAGLTNSSLTIGTTTIALGATTLTLSGLTTVTVTQDPTSALQLSTKQYVDNQVATVSNQTFHTAVGYATTADLGSVTYNNGSSGVGATLTNAGAQAALTIDGYTFTATDVTNATRVLVKNENTGAYNGAYVVTNQGSGSTNWVLTRATDFNTPGSGPNYIETGASFFVNGGTANGSTAWVMNTTGTITVGSTALTFTQSSSSGNIQVNSPLIKTGNTISLGTVAIGNGGTGQTTASAAFNALSPITSTGDLIIGNGVNSATRLGIGTSGYVLTSNGTTATWAASTGGVTSFSGGTTGLTPNTATTGAITLAGTLAIANGGTGLTALGTGVQTALGQNVTGSGGIVLATSPTLVTPALGTPSAAVLTNATGLPLTTGVTGTLGTSNGGTGLTTFTAANNAIYSTSASVLTAGTLPVLAGGTGVTSSTGTGNNVLSNSPTLVTPALGTPASGVMTNVTGLPLTTGVTGVLPTANGGTNLSSFTSGGAVYATSTTVLTTGTLPITAGGTGLTALGTGVQTALGQAVTGSGSIVLSTSPTLVTPALGTPSAAVLTNATGLPLTTGVTGTLGVTNGGTGTATAFTTGSVVFAGASGVYSQNNAKFFWDNTNNRLGINTATPQTQLTIVSNTQTTTPTAALPAGTDVYIVGANAANTRITQDAYGTGSYGVFTARSARGTAASPTASQSGDFLAQFTARGYGATGFGTASTGYIAFSAAENFTDTAQGTYASIYTTPTGSNSIAEAFRFGPAGQLGIGGATYGTSGQFLTSGGASAAPSWTTVTLATLGGVVPVASGGTNITSYTVGDLIYASASTTLSKLADVATGSVLVSGGVGVAPAWSASPTVTALTTGSISISGNETHTGTGARILGDFTNATITNRLAFQTSTTNGTTGIYALPNGTSTAASWQATNAADPTNASKILIATNGSTDVQLVSGINGTGTYLPLSFYTNGSGQFAINTSGAWGIGSVAASTVSYGTSGQAFISGGSSAQPSWGALGIAGGGTGLTSTPANGALDIGNGTGFTRTTLTQGTGITITNGSGSITVANSGVTSFSGGSTGLTPNTATTGAISLAGTLATGYGGTGLTSFTSGGAVYATSSSALTTGTLPVASGGTGLTSTPSNGQIDIGNGTGFTRTTLTAGTNITITNSSGSITIAATGGSGGVGLTWQPAQTSNFTASAGNGYPVNTTSGTITVTLPSSPSAGNQVSVVDYAGTSATNNIIVNPNGSKINSVSGNAKIQTAYAALNFVYIDSTSGWLVYSSFAQQFTGTTYSITYLAVAGGGGGGGKNAGGGGGAGGLLTNSFTGIAGTTYTITVGGGGANSGGTIQTRGGNGSNSSISGTNITTITASGGGGGGYGVGNGGRAVSGSSGGSGGGGGGDDTGGPYSGGSGTSGQGNAGGNGVSPGANAGGGGGAGAAGANGIANSNGGAGGVGLSNSITGSVVYYAGGGGGGANSSAGAGGNGGGGAGAAGNPPGSGTAGTANTGGGGGGAGGFETTNPSGAGGSGVVILSIPTALYSGTTTGSPTVTTNGSNTILKFTTSGTYTA